MKKYDKEIINSYINGTDIEGYSIDELENDKEFMMLVIRTTNDKNFYNLCSDNIKKDYDFVKFIINKFKTDIDFICKVADYFLANVEDELMRTELTIIMAGLTEKRKEEKYYEYKITSDAIFTAKRVKIEMAKIEMKDEYSSNEIGMGFLLIFDSYNSSKIVLDFYAKKFIESIFEEYDIDLENMLHQQFNSSEQINKMGINNYMLNFIGAYDSMLASYLSTNIELMKDFSNKIREVQTNWDKYNNVNEQKKYNLIFNKVHEYMEQVEDEGLLTKTDLLYYVGKELGIVEKIAKYDKVRAEFAEDIINGLDDEFLTDTFNVSFKDRVHYDNVKRIITSILFTNKYEEKSDNQKEDNKNKCKIFKLNNLK